MYLPRSLLSLLYNHLLKTHHPLSPPVLILPALEADAICACRIITALLKRDYIPHKIHPVSGYADLAKAGNDLIQPMKTNEGGSGGVVICLGVGGLVDLGSLLGLENEDPATDAMGGVEVWILDARRPWNLTNVFGSTYLPTDSAEATLNAPKKYGGVEKGCIQRAYKPGKGGIIVFDDGDIMDELSAERDAYCALEDMPDFGGDEEDFDDNDNEDHADDTQSNSDSRKRKSWSDRDDEDDDLEDDARPHQRRRSNSGSSIASPRSKASTSSSRSHSPERNKQNTAPTAIQLRKKFLAMRRSHEKVLSDYYSLGISYSEPISSLAYSLASELGRDDNDLLWLAIVGVTSLELSGHTSTGLGTPHAKPETTSSRLHHGWRITRSSRTYAALRDEVRRINPPSNERLVSSHSRTPTSSATDSSIQLVPDPRFMLLRHWSLYDSMLHSPYLAARLHVWNESGIKRLHKLLAKMGISLNQCKQGYIHMDVNLRAGLRDRLLKYAGMYGLDELVPAGEGHATYEQEGWGFLRNWGWKAQLSAVDVGVIVGAILEVGSQSPASSKSSTQTQNSTQSTSNEQEVEDRSTALLPRFFAAYDALSPQSPTKLLNSIPLAQSLLRSIQRTGSSLLSKHQIRHLRAFRMGVVKDGPDLALFANSPGALVKLALWVSEAVSVSDKDKKGAKNGDLATPLVLAALDEARGTYIVVGTGGGIGSGEDMEARKEKTEAKAKKAAEKEAKKKIREEKRAARKTARELNGDGTDDELDEDESEEEESSEEEEDSDDEAEQARQRKRGYGRNRFGIAFQEVVEETNARVKIDSFDHCVVEVKKEDLAGFLEGLSLKSVVGR